jgi:hypothetical protein
MAYLIDSISNRGVNVNARPYSEDRSGRIAGAPRL